MARPRAKIGKTPESFGIFSPGNYAGTDQGVDFSGSGPIPALGPGVVTDVGVTNGDIQGARDYFVVYQLTAGPFKGQHVYVAENFAPTVKVGQKLKLGQSVGQAPGNYPYIEVGFNQGGQGWSPVAALYPDPHGPKAAGDAMWKYIQGVIGLGPKVTGATGGVPGGDLPVTASAHEQSGPLRLGRERGGGIGYQDLPSAEGGSFSGPQQSGMQEGAFGSTNVDPLSLPLSPIQVNDIWQTLSSSANASPETRRLANFSYQLSQGTPSVLLPGGSM
jgi:hypothetical protein